MKIPASIIAGSPLNQLMIFFGHAFFIYDASLLNARFVPLLPAPMKRVAHTLLQAHSVYPLLPPAPDAQLNYAQVT